MGDAVQYVKAVLHNETQLPMTMVRSCSCEPSMTVRSLLMSAHVLAQELMFNGKPLMDPLSLEDCRGIQLGTDNCITVQVGHCSVVSAFGSQQQPTAT